jgi:hypothetical protein
MAAKMILKSYAFLKARKSFAVGHNPRLVLEKLGTPVNPLI